MNKNAKAAIAAGAGVLLLLGGGGTFALWNATTGSFAAGTITTGKLEVSDPWNDAEWTINGNASTEDNFATITAVPGDTFGFSASATITAVGDNLKFTITPENLDSISAGLAEKGWTFTGGTSLTPVFDYDEDILEETDEGVYSFIDGQNSGSVKITVSFTGVYGSTTPPNTGADNETQEGTIAFNTLAFKIQQVV